MMGGTPTVDEHKSKSCTYFYFNTSSLQARAERTLPQPFTRRAHTHFQHTSDCPNYLPVPFQPCCLPSDAKGNVGAQASLRNETLDRGRGPNACRSRCKTWAEELVPNQLLSTTKVRDAISQRVSLNLTRTIPREHSHSKYWFVEMHPYGHIVCPCGSGKHKALSCATPAILDVPSHSASA